MTTEEFIEKAKKVHNDRYNYKKVDYVNAKTKICVICPEHGEFWQLPHSHLSGRGCPTCGKIKMNGSTSFIEKSNKIHNNKYDYSKVKYVNEVTKVCITCPIHGDFWQRPHNHLNGQGCPECGKKYAKEWRKGNFENFIKSSVERFGEIYVFPNIKDEYENSHSTITIKCKKCGNTFSKIACDHLTSPNGGCQHCYFTKSKPEEEIGNFLVKNIEKDCEISFNNRTLINGNEIDIYIPSKNLAIEFNGLFWHSNKEKNYHLLKTESCEKIGVKLIQIFEDEYTFHKGIVLSKINHIIDNDYTLEKIYGRNCVIKEINFKDANDFLNKNHIQGGAKSTIYLGAYNNEELIGVMTFKKQTGEKWELNRFATIITKRCIGVGGKLFSYFIRNFNPEEIKSFADRRWTDDSEKNLYHKLGFRLSGVLRPDYRYFINGEKKRIHKFNFRKQILNKKYNLPLELTETQMAEKIGARKIWDCGLYKYVWSKE